jgi:flagellar basal-body rod protein FlgG
MCRAQPDRAEVLLLVRGLYTAASGALVAQSQADVIANNLANVNTSGFKRTLLQVQSAPEMGLYRLQNDPSSDNPRGNPSNAYVGALGMGAQVMDTPTVFEQGALSKTGNPLDLALQGNGFFSIQTPQGVRYTRDGQFSEDPAGRLVTMDGNLVLGTNGQPVQLQTSGGAVQIDRNGQITQNGQLVGTLRLVQFSNLAQVRPEGDNHFVATAAAGAAPATAATVHQGFLETSNASVVRSMVDLITAQRWYEANTKVIQTQDQANSWAISNVARTQ